MSDRDITLAELAAMPAGTRLHHEHWEFDDESEDCELVCARPGYDGDGYWEVEYVNESGIAATYASEEFDLAAPPGGILAPPRVLRSPSRSRSSTAACPPSAGGACHIDAHAPRSGLSRSASRHARRAASAGDAERGSGRPLLCDCGSGPDQYR